jgi:hypothetical protein
VTGARAPPLVEEAFGTDKAQCSSRGDDLANQCRNKMQGSCGNNRSFIPSLLAHQCWRHLLQSAPVRTRIMASERNLDSISSGIKREQFHRDNNVCHRPFTLFFSTSNYASSHSLVQQPDASRCGELIRPMTAALGTPSATTMKHFDAHASFSVLERY